MVGGNDPDNRKYLGPDGIKSSKNNPVYLHLKKLNAVRRASPALMKGVQTKLYASKDQYVFKREYNGETVFVFLNKDWNGAAVTAAIPPGSYTDIYTGGTVSVADGGSVNIPAHGLRALTRGVINGKPWELAESRDYKLSAPAVKPDNSETFRNIENEVKSLAGAGGR